MAVYIHFEGVFMKGFRFISAMLALALVLAFVSCDNGSTNGNNPGSGSADSALNGSWRANIIDAVYRFNNGSLSVFENGVELQRFSYTTTGSTLTITLTELYLNAADASAYNTSPGWKTVNQYIEIATVAINNSPYMNQDEKNRMIADIQTLKTPQTYSYSISGNTLKISTPEGPQTFTRN
jgi:hypothetical protein